MLDDPNGPIFWGAAVKQQPTLFPLPDEVDGVPHFLFPGLDVDHGGFDAAVTHELLDRRERHSLLVQDVGEGSSEPVVGDPHRESSRGCTAEDVVNTVILTVLQTAL